MKTTIAAGAIFVFILTGCTGKTTQELACENVVQLTRLRDQRLDELKPTDPISVLDDIQSLTEEIEVSRRICEGGTP